MTGFYCFVFSTDGPAVAGCSVRVLNATNQDVTALLSGGLSPFETDDAGQFSYLFADGTPAPLSAGSYSFLASAPGYEPYTGNAQTTSTFNGFGIASLQLSPLPVGSATTISREEPPYVCPMYPVEFAVDAQAPSAAWEQIETIVTSESGSTSSLLVPVVDGQALINVQARLSLDTRPVLVPDGEVAVIDPFFAQIFSITCNSITPTGSFPLQGTIVLYAANAFPSKNTNDLSNYTNDNNTGLADWLSPWGAAGVPKFEGRYADCMIWLPITGPGQYSLVRTNLDINRQLISVTTTSLDSALFASKKVVRVRLEEPVSGAYYAELVIKLGSVFKTKPLTIRYING